MARHVRKGDKVQVLSGKYKGQQGTVLDVMPDRERVRVEGVAVVKRHLKPGKEVQHPNGGIIERLGTIHWSNVQVLDPESGKPTRVGAKTLEDGRRVRVAKRSGAILNDNAVSGA